MEGSVDDKLHYLTQYENKYRLTEGAQKNADKIREELIGVREPERKRFSKGGRVFETREEVETELQLINKWKKHSPETGFEEWLPDTPQFVKDLDKTHYERFIQYEKNKGLSKGGAIKYPSERLEVSEQSEEERELELFIDNDGDLYRQRVVPIQTNLITKIAQGKFDINLAPKIYKYLIEDGMKKYAKEYADPEYGKVMLNKAQKENLAKEYVNRFLNEAALGNYEEYLPKKYKE